MEYKINKTGDNVTVSVSGRLDTVTTPDLEKYLEDKVTSFDSIECLIFDFKELKYISSAGLRLLLKIQKIATQKNKKFELHNINEFVMEVLEITGFNDILEIK